MPQALYIREKGLSTIELSPLPHTKILLEEKKILKSICPGWGGGSLSLPFILCEMRVNIVPLSWGCCEDSHLEHSTCSVSGSYWQ